jgi:hypothetical protein
MPTDFLLIASEVFATLSAPDLAVTTERGVRVDYILLRTPMRMVEIGYEPFGRPFCFVSLDERRFGRIGEEIAFPAGERLARGELSDALFAAHELELRSYLDALLKMLRAHLSA